MLFIITLGINLKRLHMPQSSLMPFRKYQSIKRNLGLLYLKNKHLWLLFRISLHSCSFQSRKAKKKICCLHSFSSDLCSSLWQKAAGNIQASRAEFFRFFSFSHMTPCSLFVLWPGGLLLPFDTMKTDELL